MIPNINPKQMQAMMKKMGISQVPINASRVIFETPEGNLVIENPDILKIMMHGQESYQITGHAELEENELKISEEDIEMVMSQTNKQRDEVIEALKKYDNDIAEAIVNLVA